MKTFAAVLIGAVVLGALFWRLTLAWFPTHVPAPVAQWDWVAFLLLLFGSAVVAVWGVVEIVLRRRRRPAWPQVDDVEPALDENHRILLTALARDPPRAVDLNVEEDPSAPFTQVELRFAARDLERRGLVFIETSGGFFVGLTDAGRRMVERRRREQRGPA